ncbi:hypothetical protein Thimo_0700 [Thioflavicoccus mobilis 8321]|uniref:SprT-like domain-containing protein n=2 Tax=Thioflavicoccus mobilis TaxID=80679 RepID=L0GW66_9GAMM|nr:hypothetical protein Thimo_0700 [Thioflavicoccus mobilis 8321]
MQHSETIEGFRRDPMAPGRRRPDAGSHLAASEMSEADFALRHEAIEQSRRLLQLAERHYRRTMPTPEIRFDLRGQAAGQARIAPTGTQIRYNRQLLHDNPTEFLNQTIPHEVAHLVAYRVFGRRIRPHGREWQAVMAFFGAPAQRCHRFAVKRGTGRQLARHAYHCACRTHALTSIRHNRVLRGRRYYCRTCGQWLRPGAHPGMAGTPADD